MSLKHEYINHIKNEIIAGLKAAGVEDDNPVVELPPSKEMGNLAFPMFKYAKVLRKNPAMIAATIAESIKDSPLIDKIETKGAYVNIFYNKKKVALEVLPQVLGKKEDFGKGDKKNIKVAIEFSSPNTNKPLHLGHCRNNVLGDAIARLMDFAGYDVTKLNLVNDRGIHICKSMLAYQKFGNGTTPEKENKKSDHLVGDFYVKYAQASKEDESLEEEAQAMLLKWENGDKTIRDLWKTMNKWTIEGIKETYIRMGIEFDEFEFESNNYLLGKDIVQMGLEKGVFFQEEDKSTWIDNSDVGLDKKIVLRADGTSVYVTQDIGTACKRHDRIGFDQMIYVVGSEQDYHFKTLFTILQKLGYTWAEKCRHLSYGMVNLPDGKMKSREGTIVDADNLMDLLYEMSYAVLEEKQQDMPADTKQDIANKISLAALKYYLLNFSTTKDVTFNPKESISFDGNTGPYLQYTTARLNSLFTKSTTDIDVSNDFIKDYKFNDSEEDLIIHLLEFEEAVDKAIKDLSPVEVCNYLYNLARIYNKFYHDNKVLTAETPELVNLRLAMSKSAHIILKNGLALLGVSALEKM